MEHFSKFWVDLLEWQVTHLAWVTLSLRRLQTCPLVRRVLSHGMELLMGHLPYTNQSHQLDTQASVLKFNVKEN